MPVGDEKVWLVGMMGAGKSTVGRALAARLGRRFVDLDAEIERAAGRSIRELFSVEGEAAFRAREAEAAAQVASGPGAVVATGGGAPCRKETLSAMRGSGPVVWLRAELDELLAGIDLASRPLLADAADPRAALARLLDERRPAYAQADLAIDRGGRGVGQLAAEIAAWLDELAAGTQDAIEVELADRAYPILLDRGPGSETRFATALGRRARHGRIGLVTDERVRRLHGWRYRTALERAGFDIVEAVVPEGEASKTMARAEEVAERLASGGLDRGSTVVALGGGVVGDLAGFVASILFRGVAIAQVPTTLLAQVDSSVGGKTAVNLPSGKNLVGTFHQPLFVWGDLGTLATLPPRELGAGLGEVVKHALLEEEGATLARLEAEAEAARAGQADLLSDLVAASVRLKARIVAGDERETAEGGGRMLLNLGHTVGHALEAEALATGGSLLHGEAVALGLLAAARVGATRPGAAPGLEARIARLLDRLGLPTDLDAWIARGPDGDVLDRVAVDKKRSAGSTARSAGSTARSGGTTVRYIALLRPGAPEVIALAPAELASILRSTTVRG